MRCTLAVVVASLVLSLATTSQAFGPVRVGAYNKQAAIGAYGRAVYPKYYWGLHSREFYNVAVPHGDIGLRGGNGFTWNPW